MSKVTREDNSGVYRLTPGYCGYMPHNQYLVGASMNQGYDTTINRPINDERKFKPTHSTSTSTSSNEHSSEGLLRNIPGYSGFRPDTRDEYGKTFGFTGSLNKSNLNSTAAARNATYYDPTMTERGDQDSLTRSHQPKQEEWKKIYEGSNKIFDEHNHGRLPGYQGFVQGHRYQIGLTYASSTHNSKNGDIPDNMISKD